MYTQILLPVDGSELSEKAIPHALGLAKTYGATIHLLQVFTHHPTGGRALGWSPLGGGTAGLRPGAATHGPPGLADSSPRSLELARQLQEVNIQEAQEYLENLATRLKNEGVDVETDIHEGEPYEHIAEYAKQHGVDIIVMSSHGHGGLKRLIMGSTTDRVIRSGAAHVLVVT